MTEFDQFIHDEFLKDIAFDIYYTADLKRIRHKYIFSKTGKNLNETIRLMKESKKRRVYEYATRYGKAPDLKIAKRLFLGDRSADEFSGGGPGVVDNKNP